MPVEFAYAQARAQARQGDRLSADTWGLLESSVGLAQFLHLLRGTALAPRVEHFSATTSPHVIERSLKREWHREVDLAMRWVPARWRAAVAWTGWLSELPAVSHLLQSGATLAWMKDDPASPRMPVAATASQHAGSRTGGDFGRRRLQTIGRLQAWYRWSSGSAPLTVKTRLATGAVTSSRKPFVSSAAAVNSRSPSSVICC
jgi:hypothetical protein